MANEKVVLNSDGKDVLLRVYDNMHQEMQEFRTTMSKLIFALGTVFLALLGLLITSGNVVLTIEKRALATSILAVFAVLIICVTRVLERYFLDIAGVINRIDNIFSLHEIDIYIPNEALFPTHWRDFGARKWREPVFRVAYWLTFVFGLLAISCVWII